MTYELQNYVPPPVDIDSVVKPHCRVSKSYKGDDAMLESLLEGAVEQVEGDSERVLGYADCVVTANPTGYDCDGLVQFKWPVVPLVSAPEDITVEYMDTDGEWQDADVTVFVTPVTPAVVSFDASSLTIHHNESFLRYRLTAKVGYNPDETADDWKPLPRNAIPAILMWIAEGYTRREAVVYARANTAFLRSYNAKIASIRWRCYP